MEHALYDNPLITRYAGKAMATLFGDRRRATLWRELWLALAELERDLGLPIAEEQLAQMRANLGNLDFTAIADYERRFRHDVMAHVHAFGDVAPAARPIIHLGATSCYVTDNADLILMREALDLVRHQLATAIGQLARFARDHRALPTLGFTHFQAAQLTTVGKRACLWIQELLFDLAELERRRSDLRLRGVKGTTGTQASFLQLFGGDHAKVRELDRRLAERFGFPGVYPVTGQTYSRKIDAQVVDALAGLAASSHRFGTDLRLLAHRKEVEEPFEAEQIGSSAMPYKRNPMRSERMRALARFLMGLPAMVQQTAATQWLERTLDDSALRRLALPQAFLAADALARLLTNVTAGLVVNPAVIAQGVAAELPFMAAESILMAGVGRGGDRQELHESIRVHSHAAAAEVKRLGRPNDLVDRLRADPAFQGLDWDVVLDPAGYVGRAPQQVEEFLAEVVEPALAGHAAGEAVELAV